MELSFSMRFFARDALCYVLSKLLQDFFIFCAKKLQIVKKERNRCAVLREKTRGPKGPQCGPLGLKGLISFSGCSFEVLEKLIKCYKVDVHVPDTEGDTAMHIACRDQYTPEKLSVVKILLQNGFNPHTLNYHGLKATANDQMRGLLLNQACRLYKPDDRSSWARREPSASANQPQTIAKKTDVRDKPAVEKKIEEKVRFFILCFLLLNI